MNTRGSSGTSDDSTSPSTLPQQGETDFPQPPRGNARRGFERAHQRAFIQDALAFLRKDPPSLLPFEVVREQLGLGDRTYLGKQSVPLVQIVGSVGRYNEFTRTFLPRTASIGPRWERIDQLGRERVTSPVQLYKVGLVYFVLDGNHRVSVARQQGAKTIDAHIWEYKTRVPLEPDDGIQDIFVRQEYLEFLDRTQLDKSRPDVYIILTMPGRYRDFEEQIAVHRHYLELDTGQTVSFQKAAEHWYDNVYQPIVRIIHREDMLRLFPGRTEADLVSWMIRNQDRLRQRYGSHSTSTRELAEDAAQLFSGSFWQRFLSWFRRKVLRWPVYTGRPWKLD
jgi:hypothetical protein